MEEDINGLFGDLVEIGLLEPRVSFTLSRYDVITGDSEIIYLLEFPTLNWTEKKISHRDVLENLSQGICKIKINRFSLDYILEDMQKSINSDVNKGFSDIKTIARAMQYPIRQYLPTLLMCYYIDGELIYAADN